MTVSRSRYELLQPRLALFTRMLQGVEEGRPRAVHRTRVAVRRLREVLPVLQLDSDVVRRLGRGLRRVTQRLGTVRELDAILLLVEAMGVSGRYDGTTLSRVAGAVAKERAEVPGRNGSRLSKGELRRLAAKLERVAEALKGEDRGREASRGCQWAVDARVRHRADALRKAVDAAGSVYLAERVHTVRIVLKKFRYAAELKAEMSGDGTWADDLAGLKRAQRLLGRLRDRQVLMDRVRQLQASLTPPDLGLWRALDSLLIAVEKECRRLHARYLRNAPELLRWCDRIAGRALDAPVRQRAG
ncbi:MAG: CHAD domain-containing protein [Acidobacteriota bacterium]